MMTLQYSDKDKRDEVFNRLHKSEELNERQVVKWSDVTPRMLSDEEFDTTNGRIHYRTIYFLAYPDECTWKRLKRQSGKAFQSGENIDIHGDQ